MTLPCRCDRGSSAYQIDGDCLAMGGREGLGERGRARERDGEGGLAEKCVSVDSS